MKKLCDEHADEENGVAKWTKAEQRASLRTRVSGLHVLEQDEQQQQAGWLATSGFAGPTFAPAVDISRSARPSYAPRLVLERTGPTTGRIHPFWHDFSSRPNQLWCTRTANGVWEASAQCEPNVTRSWEPDTVIDATGILHLVWRDRTDADDIFYARRATDGAWSIPVNLSSSSGRSSSPPR